MSTESASTSSSKSLAPGTAPRSTCAACTPSVIAKLDGWSALHTPLLMIIDDAHNAHVYGPGGCVTNLALARENIR